MNIVHITKKLIICWR